MSTETVRRVLLRNARLIDGTGAPASRSDCLIAGDRIERVAPDIEVGDDFQVIDLDGLVLAPGFIDPHTHMDAQVLWDYDLTPSSWYGVTSIVAGNCGFTLAPNVAAIRETLLRTLENVEGMPFESLVAGIPWTFESFGDYLDVVESLPIRLNFAVYIGHTAVRHAVMGGEAAEREATSDEIDQMATVVAEAVAAGAVGFSTVRLKTDVGAFGRPVASRLASTDELVRLAQAVGSSGPRVFQMLVPVDQDMQLLVDVADASKGTVLWGPALAARWGKRGRLGEILDELQTRGGDRFLGSSHSMPVVQVVNYRDALALHVLTPAFDEILALPRQGDERRRMYEDPAWLQRAAATFSDKYVERVGRTEILESPTHPEYVQRLVGDVAAELGLTPLEAMTKISLDDDLETRFNLLINNDDEEELADILRDPRTLLALSDAGAHASQICDASYGLRLLSKWVRELGVLTLEDAVHQMTGKTAEVFGMADRGVIREGNMADLVVFDPDTVADGPMERVFDLPAGAPRMVRHATGIKHVWVNGEEIHRDGEDLDARPGRLLRAAR